MVKPILCYGSEVWGTEYSTIIKSVHFTFCKYFLGVNSSVNNAVAIGERGRLPLCVFYFTNCIKYWCKLLYMHDNRYPNSYYKMLKALDEAGRENWVSEVRVLLYTYGFGYTLVAQDVGDIGLFISQFKIRLRDCMTQKWHSDITDSSRCDTYKEFKSLLDVEKYLCIDIPFYLRKAFARFRCSSHKLNIELGRHRGIARVDRICLFCFNNLNKIVVEDEYHVCFICAKFNNLRDEYLHTWYRSGDNKNHFHNVISTSNPVIIRKLCKTLKISI